MALCFDFFVLILLWNPSVFIIPKLFAACLRNIFRYFITKSHTCIALSEIPFYSSSRLLGVAKTRRDEILLSVEILHVNNPTACDQ